MKTSDLSFPIPFTKMSGTGNDFVIIDNRNDLIAQDLQSDLAKLVCRRNISVGADGLILIEADEHCDFRWQFYNADGSSAEMCGNGARCAARFAYSKKIAPAAMDFRTIAGQIHAQMIGEDVKIQLTPPSAYDLNQKLQLDEHEIRVSSINTGVPHAIIAVEDITKAPVVEWGRKIRFHQAFQPAGTNVNFVGRQGPGKLAVRTYERGVENETLACGTGAVASALEAALNDEALISPIEVTTSGGDRLIIHFELDSHAQQPVKKVFLEGPAHFIYEGQLHLEALFENDK